MKKAAKSTTRGVVVIDKAGKVQVWEQAGPQKTVDAVMAYVQSNGTALKSAPPPAPASDTTMADAPPAGASAEAAATQDERGASHQRGVGGGGQDCRNSCGGRRNGGQDRQHRRGQGLKPNSRDGAAVFIT
jgi:hypothetical protein